MDHLSRQAARARTKPDDEAVHDVRVAIRRFSQVLSAFESCFASTEVAKMRSELKRVMCLAGEVRNCDIGYKAVAKLEEPGAVELMKEIRLRRVAAEKKLLAALDRWAVRGTAEKWRAALEIEGDPAARERTLRVTAGETLPAIAKRFFKRGERAAEHDATAADLHRLRIAGKKFRYSIELFAELYGPRAGRWLEQIAAVQTLLGRVNDFHTVRLMIAGTHGNRAIDAALKKKQQRRTREFARIWAQRFAGRGTAQRWIRALEVPSPKPVASATPATAAATAVRTA